MGAAEVPERISSGHRYTIDDKVNTAECRPAESVEVHAHSQPEK